jgi:hypothetical protein
MESKQKEVKPAALTLQALFGDLEKEENNKKSLLEAKFQKYQERLESISIIISDNFVLSGNLFERQKELSRLSRKLSSLKEKKKYQHLLRKRYVLLTAQSVINAGHSINDEVSELAKLTVGNLRESINQEEGKEGLSNNKKEALGRLRSILDNYNYKADQNILCESNPVEGRSVEIGGEGNILLMIVTKLWAFASADQKNIAEAVWAEEIIDFLFEMFVDKIESDKLSQLLGSRLNSGQIYLIKKNRDKYEEYWLKAFSNQEHTRETAIQQLKKMALQTLPESFRAELKKAISVRDLEKLDLDITTLEKDVANAKVKKISKPTPQQIWQPPKPNKAVKWLLRISLGVMILGLGALTGGIALSAVGITVGVFMGVGGFFGGAVGSFSLIYFSTEFDFNGNVKKIPIKPKPNNFAKWFIIFSVVALLLGLATMTAGIGLAAAGIAAGTAVIFGGGVGLNLGITGFLGVMHAAGPYSKKWVNERKKNLYKQQREYHQMKKRTAWPVAEVDYTKPLDYEPFTSKVRRSLSHFCGFFRCRSCCKGFDGVSKKVPVIPKHHSPSSSRWSCPFWGCWESRKKPRREENKKKNCPI